MPTGFCCEVYYADKMLEFAFTHTNRFSEEYFSFVNGQFTLDGGTHLSAFREGVARGVNEFYPKGKQTGLLEKELFCILNP